MLLTRAQRMCFAIGFSLISHLLVLWGSQIRYFKGSDTDVYEAVLDVTKAQSINSSDSNRILTKYQDIKETMNIFLLENKAVSKIQILALAIPEKETVGKKKKPPIVNEPYEKPKLIYSTKIPYPNRANGVEGDVTVRILVSIDGLPEYVATANSSGNPILDGAALDECIKWRFSPARNKNGKPVRCLTYISVRIHK